MVKIARHSLLSVVAVVGALVSVASASHAQTTTLISSTVNNGSFETPLITTQAYSPAGATWTFTSGGIATPSNSPFGLNGSVADGTQVGFLQYGGTSTVSQSFSLSSASDISLTFAYAGRTANGVAGGVGSIAAFIDGAPISATFTTTTGQVFTSATGAATNIAAGTHTFSFTATGSPTNDNTIYVDNVNLTATASAAAPEPGAMALVASALPIAGVAIRRRRKA